MTDLLTENARLRAALERIASGAFSGLVLTTYPPKDPAQEFARSTLAALATPAPDAVQEAVRVLLDDPQAAAQFVVEYMERETGLPFGDMIGLSEMQRIRAIAGGRT